MREAIGRLINWFIKAWVLLLVIGVALFVFGDWAQLASGIYKLSVICLVLMITDFMLDSRAGKGVFPSLDLDAALRKAIGTPIGAALVWCGYVALVIAIIAFSVGK